MALSKTSRSIKSGWKIFSRFWQFGLRLHISLPCLEGGHPGPWHGRVQPTSEESLARQGSGFGQIFIFSPGHRAFESSYPIATMDAFLENLSQLDTYILTHFIMILLLISSQWSVTQSLSERFGVKAHVVTSDLITVKSYQVETLIQSSYSWTEQNSAVIRLWKHLLVGGCVALSLSLSTAFWYFFMLDRGWLKIVMMSR